MSGPVLVLAGVTGFAHPLISAVTIFLMAALIGARLFSETTAPSAAARLGLLVGLSGAAALGAIAVSSSLTVFGKTAAFLAVALATAGAVGGFLVTRRLAERDGSAPQAP
jgi:hypothetical protein